MKKRKLKKKFKYLLIIYAIFISLGLTQITFSKYIGNLFGISNNVTVAKPILEIVSSNNENIILPNGELLYYFDIVNYDANGNINETLLKYQIDIIIGDKFPLEYDLYFIDNGENILVDNNTYYNYVKASLKEEDKYLIVFKWANEEYRELSILENVENSVTIETTNIQVLDEV